jgi:hypothetical protein
MTPLSGRWFFPLLLLYNFERNYTTIELGDLDGLFYPDPAGHKGYFFILDRRWHEGFCLTIEFLKKTLDGGYR